MAWKLATGANRRIRRSFVTRGTGRVAGWISGTYCGMEVKDIDGSCAQRSYLIKSHNDRSRKYWESEEGVTRMMKEDVF